AWILVAAMSVLMTTLVILGTTSASGESVAVRALRVLLIFAIAPAPLLVKHLPSCMLVLQLFVVCALQLGLDRLLISATEARDALRHFWVNRSTTESPP